MTTCHSREATPDAMTGSRPHFTVLVPTYNHDQYLGAALDSLLAQTDGDWEAIVVDDGSTDRTAAVIAAYCSRDSRIQGIKKDNGGVASALNVGLRRARGAWICWLSSDDLFDAAKLAVHRKWIARCPESRFFVTQPKQLYEETGEIHHPQLRAPRQAQWQVLEMLRRNYVAGNSVCIEAEALRRVGEFDERLRNAQDYDMWLRLVSVFPATVIPERTCITRCHALQDSRRFPRAGGYDSALAAINFINEHSFSQLVPLVDLADRPSAKRALERALDVAADSSGLLYKLGPHPALLLRILEWVSSCRDDDTAGLLSETLRRWALDASSQYAGTTFGSCWKALLGIRSRHLRDVTYAPVLPLAVAEDYYGVLQSGKDDESGQLARYLDRHACRPSNGDSARNGAGREVIVACRERTRLAGSLTALEADETTRVARMLRKSGRTVVVVCSSPRDFGVIDGSVYVGIDGPRCLSAALGSLGPVDTLIAESSTDAIRLTSALRYVVRLSADASSADLSAAEVNRMGVNLVCASEEGRAAAVAAGVWPRLVHVAALDSIASILDTIPARRSVTYDVSRLWWRVRSPRGFARRLLMGGPGRRLASLFWSAVGTPPNAWPCTVRRKLTGYCRRIGGNATRCG